MQWLKHFCVKHFTKLYQIFTYSNNSEKVTMNKYTGFMITPKLSHQACLTFLDYKHDLTYI